MVTKNIAGGSIKSIVRSTNGNPVGFAIVNSQVSADQQAFKSSDVIRNTNGVSLGTTCGTTSLLVLVG